MVNDRREQAARDKAITHLQKRRDFLGHLLIYMLVNTFVVVIWMLTGANGRPGPGSSASNPGRSAIAC